MRKKLAIITAFVMFFQFVLTGMFIPLYETEAITSPRITQVTVEEVQQIVNGVRSFSFRVELNGLNVNKMESLLITRADGGQVVKSIDEFRILGTNKIEAIGIQSLSGFFGTAGNEVTFTIIDAEGNAYESATQFDIPAETGINVDKINDINYPSWPASVIMGPQNNVRLEGTGFNALAATGTAQKFKLYTERGSFETEVQQYEITDDGEVVFSTHHNGINSGINQSLIFQRQLGNVVTRFKLVNAINITAALNLGDPNEIEVTPLRGTEGTIVRIKVPNFNSLIQNETKVFIGGIEAKRNVVEDEGRTGIFEYEYEEAGEMKIGLGLEVSVPVMTSGPEKEIRIQNHLGDTYIHHQRFTYYDADTPPLHVTNVNPNSGPVGRRNTIDLLTIQNLLKLTELSGVTDSQEFQLQIGNKDNLKYPSFIEQAEGGAGDEDLYFVRYEISENTYVERKISLTIGRPARITRFTTLEEQIIRQGEGKVTLGSLPGSADLRVETSEVGTANTVPVRVRTETVYVENGVEKEFIVEQAPYPSLRDDQIKKYTFTPDSTTPLVTNIIPAQGRFDRNIIVTIEGSNFHVGYDNTTGERYYPNVVIGKPGNYKVINQSGMYWSDSADGRYIEANKIGEMESGEYINYIPLTVLNNEGNVVDGQIRTTGTQIKLTIPGDLIRDYYTGAADIIVRNPTASGELGNTFRAENIFEYLPRPNVNPIIESVAPDKVAVGSEEQVTIIGRNFQPEMRITIDGVPANNVNINAAAGIITFNAPRGREGKTFIQIINPNTGGMATHPFEYIRTYSAPRIERIIPNIGGKGSLVIIKGSNFYLPDEEGATEESRIGTKVLIDGKDVNAVYHTQGQDFTHPFDDQIIKGPDGEAIMTYGSHMAVVDNNTIYMIVPDPLDNAKPFPTDRLLSVEVVNPDLGRHRLNNAFKIVDVARHPKIDQITPQLGDYRGGNIAQIDGEYFLPNSKVYFGTQEAQVYRRSTNGRTLWVYVPPHGEALGDHSEALVPVTVQNPAPNSGAYTRYDGYLYRNPGYQAAITKIEANVGNTSGGDRVVITGQNFRAFKDGSGVRKPEVYFGGTKVDPAQVRFVLQPPKDEADYNTLETAEILVIENTPPNPAGKVDVTIINYDGATAISKDGFEYRSRQPAITQILPNQGSIYGGSEITITGREFIRNGLHVAFGEETKRADAQTGQAMVQLGDIIVHYDAFRAGNNIQLYYGEMREDNRLPAYLNPTDQNPMTGFNLIEEAVYQIATIRWKEIAEAFGDQNLAQLADEGIKVEIKDGHLQVARRLGVIKRVEGENRITVITPPGKSHGATQVTVYNHDGTKASGNFTYTNPFRPPVIEKITPVTTVTTNDITGDELTADMIMAPPKGGSPIIIEGENFRSGVQVYIGDQRAEIRNKSANDDELIVIMPQAAGEVVGPYLRILVINDDGGFTYGDTIPQGSNRNPYYARYIVEGSNPVIHSIEPNQGPTSGGTQVTIKGNNFKAEDTFGNPQALIVRVNGIEVPQSDIEWLKIDELIIKKMPQGVAGPATIEVINYDFGTAIGNNIFTYISQPRITNVNPGRLFTNDTETEVTITGEMFQQGAKVIVGGRLIPEKDVKGDMIVQGTGIRGVDEQGQNRRVAVIGGIQAANVIRDNEGRMRVQFPEAFDLERNDMIIINPDGGISSPYEEFEYQIPIPTKPLVLEAIPGFEGTVQLIWSDSDPELLNATDRYEIYGRRSGERQYSLLSDTEAAQHLVRGLENGVRYDFMVRALNRYGSALEFAEVTVRTLSAREDDKTREKEEQLEKEQQKLDREGKEEVINGTLVKTLGKDQIPAGQGAYVIDFSSAQYSKHNRFVVAIPVEAINTIKRQVTITDGRGSFTFSPSAFYTRDVIQIPRDQQKDATVRIAFERVNGQAEQSLIGAIPRIQRRASDIYGIDFELQIGRNTTAFQRMLTQGHFTLNYDAYRYPNANSSRLFMAQYDVSQGQFARLNNQNQNAVQYPGRYMLLSDR